MKGSIAWAATLALAISPGYSLAQDEALSAGSSTVFDQTREAYGLASPAMPAPLRDAFFLGRSLFRQVWVVAPAMDRDVSGLGPLFNRPSCAACHLKNGRGRAPEDPSEKMTTMLVRLSLPGAAAHGEPLPHPVYGDQLNDAAIPGIPAEGQARVRWEEHTEHFSDGTQIRLRKPRIEFSELAYGPMGTDVRISPRIAPPVFGLGLLENIPEEAILALAARQETEGVSGRPNRVWDPVAQREVLGRFGWKANIGTLLHQTASALLGDLGITSPILELENCTATQALCLAAPSAGKPELESQRLAAMVLYQQSLGVPARREVDHPQVMRGARLFDSAGCGTCHVTALETGDHPSLPFLSRQTIHPYTDLLLHDMGEGLSDDRPDFLAGGREWRTPPLWGIGLTERINGHAAYLHDGRARTLFEAIFWHGGEAEPAREAARKMDKNQRAALLRFLQSL